MTVVKYGTTFLCSQKQINGTKKPPWNRLFLHSIPMFVCRTSIILLLSEESQLREDVIQEKIERVTGYP